MEIIDQGEVKVKGWEWWESKEIKTAHEYMVSYEIKGRSTSLRPCGYFNWKF